MHPATFKLSYPSMQLDVSEYKTENYVKNRRLSTSGNGDVPELTRTLYFGRYWLCENVNREMFFRSHRGTWFELDPQRPRFFVESENSPMLEKHYGIYCRSTKANDCSANFEPWRIRRDEAQSCKMVRRSASCTELICDEDCEFDCSSDQPKSNSAITCTVVSNNKTCTENETPVHVDEEVHFKQTGHSNRESLETDFGAPLNYLEGVFQYDGTPASVDRRESKAEEAGTLAGNTDPSSDHLPSTGCAERRTSQENSVRDVKAMQNANIKSNKTTTKKKDTNLPDYNSSPSEIRNSSGISTEEESIQLGRSTITPELDDKEAIHCQPTQSSESSIEHITNDCEGNAISDSQSEISELSDDINATDNARPLLVECQALGDNHFQEIYKVFSELRRSHPMKYRAKRKCLQCFPWVKISQFVKQSLFFDFDFITSKENNSCIYYNGYVTDLLDLLLPGTRIIITGAPGFGKTTLCSLIEMLWLKKYKRSMKQVKLCLRFNLKDYDIDAIDISESIIKICSSAIRKSKVEEEFVKQTLTYASSNVLLILDGLDEIPSAHQNRLQVFLAEDPVFSNACIILTTRPGYAKPCIQDLCQTRVDIKGLNSDRLLYLVSKWEKKFHEVGISKSLQEWEKLNLLYELSPVLAYFISCVIHHSWGQQNTSDLYSLLEKAVHEIVSQNKERRELFNFKELFLKVGRLFFCALFSGQMRFEENLLQTIFKNGCRFLLHNQFFYKERRESNGDNIWCASSKILVVFFAVYYLRHKWSVCKNDKSRFWLVRKAFFLNDCTGDYIIGGSSNPCLYFVGLLPEIVLNLGTQPSLAKAKFDMYYDTERIENSQAFDSVNLLLRIEKQRLSRFHFEEICENSCEETMLQNTLEPILNTLNFDNATVDLGYFHNQWETSYFLKIQVNNPYDDTIVLRTVVKVASDLQVERILFDVTFQDDIRISDFLGAVFAYSCPGFEMCSEDMNSSIGEYVCALTQCFLQCDLHRNVHISCTGNMTLEHLFISNTVKFSIHPTSSTTKLVVFSEPTISERIQKTCNRNTFYDIDSFRKAKSALIENINNRTDTKYGRSVTLTLF